MTTIVTRTSKGSPLSWIEADANLTNLNNDKLEAAALAPYLTSATAASTYETQAHATATFETQAHATATFPTKANNLSDLASAATARTNLGLGTAATLDVGTTANKVVQLDGSAKLPAVDGSQLTGLATGGGVVGAFRNLQASANGTSANISVTVDEIVVENSSNAYVTLRSVSLTIAGTTTGANALDTGTIAASTWYSVWVIYNGTTTAGLLSTSATSPTMPSGYTHKARVGWIRTDGTANKYPLCFIQYGRRVQYKVAGSGNVLNMPVMANGATGSTSTPTWTAVGVSAFVPPSATKISLSVQAGSAASQPVGVCPNNAYGGRISLTNPPYFMHYPSNAGNVSVFDMILESSNIYWACEFASVLLCNGWEDNL